MNLRMMFYGRRMATDGDPLNDQMTAQAVKFMESQISDPVLREKVRPNSKCKLYCPQNLVDCSLRRYRLLQATSAAG